MTGGASVPTMFQVENRSWSQYERNQINRTHPQLARLANGSVEQTRPFPWNLSTLYLKPWI